LKNATDFSNAPSFPIFTLGSFISPAQKINGVHIRRSPKHTSDGKAMRTALPVFPLVSRRELATSKNLVGYGLSLVWELGVHGARVDQERSFGCLEVFLDGTERMNIGNVVEYDKRRLTSRSSGILSSEGCATTDTLMTCSKARSNTYRPIMIIILHALRITNRLCIPPKQYPVPPNRVTPSAFKAAITGSIPARVGSLPCFPNHSWMLNPG
jgi:hypothetical protein